MLSSSIEISLVGLAYFFPLPQRSWDLEHKPIQAFARSKESRFCRHSPPNDLLAVNTIIRISLS
jgi:hypothetical protein